MPPITQHLLSSAYYAKQGVAVLPLMILIGAIIIEISIVGGILAFYGSTSNLSIRASQEALFTARSGIEDAKLKLIRNKDISAIVYTVSVNSGAATTTASTSISIAPVCPATQRIIVATSTVFRRTKTIKAIVNIDCISGKVDLISEEEVTN
ncbi:MAG: hypothetical protein Q8L47_01590 [bacterium]|nr:hypothetical protein [bacterium]